MRFEVVDAEAADGQCAPGKIGGHKKRTLSGEIADWLRARMRGSAFTLRGLVVELAERGVKTQARAVWVFAHAEGLSFKKTLVASEQTRPDVARKRTRWKARQASVDRKRLVFIDETWVKTNMEPLRGWGPRKERLKAHVPHGHWKTMTFLAALRHDRIDAPWVIDGPINGKVFSAYVEKILVPTLAQGTLSCSTISAATRESRRARPFEPQAPTSCSCLHTAPTSIRSSRSSPSSNT